METGNRENIIQTALDLFSLQGYEATGVMEIADKSGISKPTMYHYFGNKRGLLDAIIASHGKKIYDAIDQGCVYHHDIVMNLTVLTRSVITAAISDEAFFRFYQALAAAAPGNECYHACEPLRTSVNERLEELFTQASVDHGNMKGRARAYSHSFQGMYNTWAMLVLNKQVDLNDDTLQRSVHQFMHGIFS
jgi:AcrR family transcriptional regulator